MRDQLIKALLAHAQGDIQKHVANVEVYLTNPAGIGEHSNIVEAIEEEFDTVIMNPPFGSQRPGADRIFLEKAMSIAKNIWTIHLSETRKFIEKTVENHNCQIIEIYGFDYPLKKSMPFHSKESSSENAILYHIASLPK